MQHVILCLCTLLAATSQFSAFKSVIEGLFLSNDEQMVYNELINYSKLPGVSTKLNLY